jgi:hypothetical protein
MSINKQNIEHCLKVLNMEFDKNMREMSGSDNEDIQWEWSQLLYSIGSLKLLNERLEKKDKHGKR